jgi:RNA polymerase sigma-70 factor (ECF subfamily)
MTLEENIKKFDITNFKSWLYRVTVNECFMLLRKQNKIHFHEIEENILIDEVDEDPAIHDCFEYNLEKGLNQLKVEHQRALLLFYLENKSYIEISKEMSWDLKAVKSHIQNGKRNLKILLQKLCNG